jgi:glutamyl-tRNA reductase
MGNVVVGLSHRTAPVTTRERVAFSRDEVLRALEQFGGLEGIGEALILSTCNRVELVAHAEEETEAIAVIRGFLHNYHGLRPGDLDPFLYEFRDAAAVRHVFRVACGLDSMVIGECQILGQIRDACNAAQQAGCMGSNLTRLMIHTSHIAKRVRNETAISAASWSVSRAAVELAKRTLGELNNRTILVVGAGKMSQLTTKHLCRSGAQNVLVTNRTYERAATIAALFQGEAVPFEHLNQALARSDIVISSAASTSGYVIWRSAVEQARLERRNHPMLFIDIAVPRNVEPTITTLENVHLCDIDGLRGVVASHQQEVISAVEAAEQMVQAAVNAYSSQVDVRELGPLITALRTRAQSIGCAELERHFSKLTNSSPQDRHHLEAMVNRIVNKILHPLIMQLKRQTRSSTDKADYIEALTVAFTPTGEGEGCGGYRQLAFRS